MYTKIALAPLNFVRGQGVPGTTVFQAMKGDPQFKMGTLPSNYWFYPLMGTKYFMGIPKTHQKRLEKAKDQQEARRILQGLAYKELQAMRANRRSPGTLILVSKSGKGYQYQPVAIPGMPAKQANGDMVEAQKRGLGRRLLKMGPAIGATVGGITGAAKTKSMKGTLTGASTGAGIGWLPEVYAEAADQMKKRAALQKLGGDPIIEVPRDDHPVRVKRPVKRKGKDAKFPFQGQIDFQGLKIDIENKRGSYRKGEDKDGNKWKCYMHHHYGEIRNTRGVDGDNLDAYIGPNHDSALVVVIHQVEPDTGKYDEDKVMLGFNSVEEAIGAYKNQYDKPGFYKEGKHTVMSIGRFWRWVHDRKKHGKKVASWREKLADVLQGGTAQRLSASAVPPETLKKGIKVEMEHTDDPRIAEEIALDHLSEGLDYYSRLEEMEEEMKEGEEEEEEGDDSKEAAAKKQKYDPTGDVLKGTGALAGAGVAAHAAAPKVTGRTTMYYGGSPGALDKLREGGLKTRLQAGIREGVTDAFTEKKVNEASKDLAFATTKKYVAKTYAAQKNLAREYMAANPGTPMNEALRAIRTDPKYAMRLQTGRGAGKRSVAKLRVPLWKLQDQGRIAPNPEVSNVQRRMGGALDGAAKKFMNRRVENMLGERGGTYAFRGGLGPEYVAGSSKFRRLGLKELAEYAKARPGTFATGLGITALGTGAGIYGGHKLMTAYKQHRKQADFGGGIARHLGRNAGTYIGGAGGATVGGLLGRRHARLQAEDAGLRGQAAKSSIRKGTLVGAGVGGLAGGVVGRGADMSRAAAREMESAFGKGWNPFDGAGAGAGAGPRPGAGHRNWEQDWDEYFKNFRQRYGQGGARGGAGPRPGAGGPRPGAGGGYRPPPPPPPPRGAPDVGRAASFFGIDPSKLKTQKDVKKAYRAAAMKHHPDRGGDVEKMKKVNDIWDKVQNAPWFQSMEKGASSLYDLFMDKQAALMGIDVTYPGYQWPF